jgi:hypothetical protein
MITSYSHHIFSHPGYPRRSLASPLLPFVLLQFFIEEKIRLKKRSKINTQMADGGAALGRLHLVPAAIAFAAISGIWVAWNRQDAFLLGSDDISGTDNCDNENEELKAEIARSCSHDSVFSVGLNRSESTGRDLSKFGAPCFYQPDFYQKVVTLNNLAFVGITLTAASVLAYRYTVRRTPGYRFH